MNLYPYIKTRKIRRFLRKRQIGRILIFVGVVLLWMAVIQLAVRAVFEL